MEGHPTFEAALKRLEGLESALVKAVRELKEYLETLKRLSDERARVAEAVAQRRALRSQVGGYYKFLKGSGSEEEAVRRSLVYSCAAWLDRYEGGFTVKKLAVTVAWACIGMEDAPFTPTDKAVQLLSRLPLDEALNLAEEKVLNVSKELFKGNGYDQLRDEVKALCRMGFMRGIKNPESVDPKKRREELTYHL